MCEAARGLPPAASSGALPSTDRVRKPAIGSPRNERQWRRMVGLRPKAVREVGRLLRP